MLAAGAGRGEDCYTRGNQGSLSQAGQIHALQVVSNRLLAHGRPTLLLRLTLLQALKNHPDKNPSPEAAEAFKRSAAAFGGRPCTCAYWHCACWSAVCASTHTTPYLQPSSPTQSRGENMTWGATRSCSRQTWRSTCPMPGSSRQPWPLSSSSSVRRARCYAALHPHACQTGALSAQRTCMAWHNKVEIAGVPLKTSVPPQLLEAAYEGRCPAQPLQFGVAVEGTVSPACSCHPCQCLHESRRK